MAPSFGRSISFPLSPARSSSSSKEKGKGNKAARHVRSISLPCRSHPLLAHLHTQIAAVRAWAAHQPTSSASAGLAHIGALHAAIAEVLLLPEAQDAVRSSSSSERLMDALLVLADAHQGFQETLLSLKADVAEVQAALRRRDAARIASAARSQRKNDKDLARLAAALLVVSSSASSSSKTTTTTTSLDEMAAALMDAAAASAAASAAVFSAVASMSTSSLSSSSSSKKTATFAAAFTKKTEVTSAHNEDKLEELAQCIRDCETATDMVFRSIVRTRVSLLNIRTPAI
ncbi:hypothetical protein PR202_ga14324 [Eleusine coracana subsp. coracana]|uniref:Uncharacterized protein n=1 Tax=Eleusine coracana subsp. coracana TaxID=191504 RepID=A0AAV5CH10_ELECO|nr:hypothetical protein PR202_ga14324 [Eleusine coracana subsp. coracana]